MLFHIFNDSHTAVFGYCYQDKSDAPETRSPIRAEPEVAKSRDFLFYLSRRGRRSRES